jgi:hypothetical protein
MFTISYTKINSCTFAMLYVLMFSKVFEKTVSHYCLQQHCHNHVIVGQLMIGKKPGP